MTCLLDGDGILSLTEGLISAKKQKNAVWLDLTVKHISRVDSGGALDFGGSEFRDAGSKPLIPEKKSPTEPYGWWHLGPGQYHVQFNETIRPGQTALILVVGHSRLIAAGASHSPVIVDTLGPEARILLNVGPAGLEVKENARVSRAVVLI